jgi:hypothetical protein
VSASRFPFDNASLNPLRECTAAHKRAVVNVADARPSLDVSKPFEFKQYQWPRRSGVKCALKARSKKL